MEGSALGVPRDEVGLGEQWELLLLLQELWVLEPAMRWTTGFWAKSTPARHRERDGLLGLRGGTAERDSQQSKEWSMQPQRPHPNRKGLSTRQAGLETDQKVNQDIRRDPPGLVLAASVTGMFCLQRTERSPTASMPLEERSNSHRRAVPGPRRGLCPGTHVCDPQK